MYAIDNPLEGSSDQEGMKYVNDAFVSSSSLGSSRNQGLSKQSLATPAQATNKGEMEDQCVKP